jgi:hypothetical protein
MTQMWSSLQVATDIVALLLHVCSSNCLEAMPDSPKGYLKRSHKGGLGWLSRRGQTVSFGRKDQIGSNMLQE